MSVENFEQFGSAIILAGGKSSRMGFDKQLLQIKDHHLVRHHGRVLAALFDQIIVVTNNQDLYRDTAFTLTGDKYFGQGPLGGLHAGLKLARSRYVYLLACDMPFVNLDYIRHMQKRLENQEVPACVTRFGSHLEPFNGFYHRRLADAIEVFIAGGSSSLFRFLGGVDTLYIPEAEARRFSPDWSMFANLNTRQEYEQWRLREPDLGLSPEAGSNEPVAEAAWAESDPAAVETKRFGADS